MPIVAPERTRTPLAIVRVAETPSCIMGALETFKLIRRFTGATKEAVDVLLSTMMRINKVPENLREDLKQRLYDVVRKATSAR